MVQDGCVEHRRGCDSTRGEEGKWVYGKINPLFPSVILRIHFFILGSLKESIDLLLTY